MQFTSSVARLLLLIALCWAAGCSTSVTDQPREPVPSLIGSIKVARIKYVGKYDPEPLAFKEMSKFLRSKCGLNFDYETVTPDQLASHDLAFLTTTGIGQLSDSEAAIIRSWIESGGTLWIDAARGEPRAVVSAMYLANLIAPNAPANSIFIDHPLITGKGLPNVVENSREKHPSSAAEQWAMDAAPHAFDNSRVKYRGINAASGTAHRLQSIDLYGRIAIVFSMDDISFALADTDQPIYSGYTPKSARQLVANMCLGISLNKRTQPAR